MKTRSLYFTRSLKYLTFIQILYHFQSVNKVLFNTS